MIYSMTGYAAVQRDLGPAILHLELKSVNSRYLDINFRIGEELRFLEMPLRELIASRVGRGKFECRGGLTQSAVGPRELSANREMLNQLAALQGKVRAVMPEAAPLTTADILRWPGVLGEQTLAQETLQAECLSLAAQALDEFVATREREGEKMAAMILDRVIRMRELVAHVAPLLPRALAGPSGGQTARSGRQP